MHVIYSAGTVTPIGSPRVSPISTPPYGSPKFQIRYSPNHTPRGTPRSSPRRSPNRHPISPLTEGNSPLLNTVSNHHDNDGDHNKYLHNVHMPKDENDQKNTIPTMSRGLAITCFVLNVIFPGLGE